MPIEVIKTTLPGVRLTTIPVFRDHRGTYTETYNAVRFMFRAEPSDFCCDCASVSHQNVLRGIHGDDHTWKLISCLYGSIYLVVVCWDEASEFYKKWEAFTLTQDNGQQVLVPPKHGNGHLVISPVAVFHYKQSAFYNPARQFTIAWNDPELAIPWPIRDPILSKRDREAAAIFDKPVIAT